jgi:hypothetical protein
VIRDFNPLFHEELANQLPNQRSKKLAVVDSTPFILVGMARKYLVKTNCLPGLPNGTSIAPSKSKFDAGSPVSPLNNSTYFFPILAEGAWRFISRFEFIDSVYASLERKKLGACRTLTLVDQRLQ